MAETENWRLDQEDLARLTDLEKDTLNTLEKLVESPGWKLVDAWAKASADEQLGYLINAGNWEQNRMAYAARFVYLQLANFEQVMTSEFKLKSMQRAQEIEEKAEVEERELT
jgi:hypothetical protein